jgi:folate-binding protein YgfZ
MALRGGDGVYACALTAKGRIIADVRIHAVAGDDGTVQTLLVDANEAGGAGFAAMIRKYVNPRLAKYVDVSATTACLTLVGDGALDLLHTVGATDDALRGLRTGAAFTHRPLEVAGLAVRLVRAPDLGDVPTFDLHMDRASHDAVHSALITAGAAMADDAEWHRRRVTAGRPEWGIDMDESTLAQEANMDALQAISYKKGCYTGQETVARVHFRGHVNRTLRSVSYPDGVLPPVMTPLVGAEGAAVGDARSATVTVDGRAIGMAMLRREVGDAATLSWTHVDAIAHPVIVIGSASE